MAASESDFNTTSDTAGGGNLSTQWPGLSRGIKALALYFLAKIASGTEPNDVLHGIMFGLSGQTTNHKDWRLLADGVGNLLIQENTNTEASPTWTTRASFAAGGGFGDAPHASTHETGGADTINHDSLTGFEANEHVDHTVVTLTAGAGLSGGGDISASRSFAVDFSELSDVALDTSDYFVIEDGADNGSKKANVSDMEGLLSSNIARLNTEQEYTKTQGATEVTTGSSGGTYTQDMSATNYHDLTLTENVTTHTISNTSTPGWHTLVIRQAASGGPYTFAWNTNIIWDSTLTAAPTVSSGASEVDLYSLFVDKDGTVWGFVGAQAAATV